MMLAYNPDVDDITDELTRLVGLVFKEFKQKDVNHKHEQSIVGALWVSFHLSREYFMGARDALKQNHLFSGILNVRSNIENISDLFYLLSDEGKSKDKAQDYVKSMRDYQEVINKVHQMKAKDIADGKLLNNANKWTTKTIADRLRYLGDSLTLVYDLFSVMSHPNPAAIPMIGNPEFNRLQINLAKQSNCTTMLFTITIIMNNLTLDSVSLEELESAAKALGITLQDSGNY